MQIDFRGVYQRSLLGGLGGLLGWALMTTIGAGTGNVYLADLWTGALVGLSMGTCCGAWDGVFRSRSVARAVRGAGTGAVVGVIGGMVGLVLGEVIHSVSGGGLVFRALGWAIFGSLLGINEGVSRRMVTKMTFGAYGGFLGGLMGGSTYEWLYGMCRVVLPRHLSQAVGGAVGLVILGLFVGAMIGLVEDLLRAAWIQFLNGRLEGQTRTLDPLKRITMIGRSELSEICIMGNPGISSRHAQIVAEGGEFVLEPVEGQVQIDRAGRLSPVTREPLKAGDVVLIGGQRVRFLTGGK